MLHLKQDLYYQSDIFNRYPGLVHGYSSRSLGDMRQNEYRRSFLSTLGITSQSLVMGEQIHGNSVKIVNVDSSSPIPAVDGLVNDMYKNSDRALGVITADCVPMLFADLKAKCIAVAHAGWKGAQKKIALEVIRHMNVTGAHSNDIMVSIGPHIGMCCYTVPEDRARMFLSEYKHNARVASFIDGAWHVDIGYINRLQLIGAGVIPENIDTPIMCTSCQNSQLYSYRKDSKETFGEIMGVIAFVA